MFKWAIFHSYVKEPGVYCIYIYNTHTYIHIYIYITESTKLLRLCQAFFSWSQTGCDWDVLRCESQFRSNSTRAHLAVGPGYETAFATTRW